MRHSTPTPVLRQARQHLIEFGNTPPGAINERLAQSWQRSLAAGLLPMGRLTSTEHASGTQLRQTLGRNHDLLAHSRPVMEYLYDQVRHIQSVVILADNKGTLMHTLGDAYFLNKAERVALATGASWHEAHPQRPSCLPLATYWECWIFLATNIMAIHTPWVWSEQPHA